MPIFFELAKGYNNTVINHYVCGWGKDFFHISPRHYEEDKMKHQRKANSTTRFILLAVFFLALLGSFGAVQAATLSEAEKEDLIYMREEEKLARDVYLGLYDTWKIRIFKNIAASEQTHMNSIKVLLDRYGIPDPAAGKQIGEFTNPEFSALYDELLRDGRQSLVEAMKVGVTIEEKDIADLQEALSQTTHPDVKLVYKNLLSASNSHLKAFISQLAKLGVTFQP